MKHLYVLFILFYSIGSNGQEKFITIGNGGGFSGSATIYKITSSGKVYKGKGIGDINYTECSKIKKSKASRYIQSFSSETQSNTLFNHPGNLYYFIGYSEDNTNRKVIWGDAAHQVPESILKLYQEINNQIQSLRYKPIK